jgi:hypothetical protein
MSTAWVDPHLMRVRFIEAVTRAERHSREQSKEMHRP